MTQSLAVRRGFCLIVAAVVSVVLMACKAQEAPVTGFTENPELMSRDQTTPFQRTYWNKKYDKAAYTELFVTPVNTRYIMAQNFWEKSNVINVTPEQIQKDIAMMAEYTRESFISAAKNDPNKRFVVVDTPGPKTLILELAITQLVPSKAVLNAMGYVHWAPAVVMMSGSTASGSQDVGKGVVSIEGRVRDGATGEIIGMFTDTEHPKTAIIDIKALNWWAPAKDIINDWSRQLMALANRRPGEVVKDSPAFELLVW